MKHLNENNRAFFSQEFHRIQKKPFFPSTWLEQTAWSVKILLLISVIVLLIVGIYTKDVNEIKFAAATLIILSLFGIIVQLITLQITWITRKNTLIHTLPQITDSEILEQFDSDVHKYIVFTRTGFYSKTLCVFQSYNEPLYRVQNAAYYDDKHELHFYTQVHRFFKTIPFALPTDWSEERGKKLAQNINSILTR